MSMGVDVEAIVSFTEGDAVEVRDLSGQTWRITGATVVVGVGDIRFYAQRVFASGGTTKPHRVMGHVASQASDLLGGAVRRAVADRLGEAAREAKRSVL